jgi:hypothetical protein
MMGADKKGAIVINDDNKTPPQKAKAKVSAAATVHGGSSATQLLTIGQVLEKGMTKLIGVSDDNDKVGSKCK